LLIQANNYIQTS